jgi:bifunctional UDP-N-acetylglucosamine pyrophosphorylase/glucosamine-1-phosphate N-acetyltransferase
MKAVILAAGKSTRTYPLTMDRPKALIKVAGRYIIQHQLGLLEGLADEVIIVVGFRKDLIKQALGKEFQGIRLTYAEQDEQLGTGHALLAAEPFIGNESFMLMPGDDMFCREDIGKLLKDTPSVLAQEVEDSSSFGTWDEKDGFVSGFQEKPDRAGLGLVNTCMYALGPEIFMHIKKLRKTVRGEYELNEAVFSMSKEKPVRIVKTRNWVPGAYPWSMLDVNKVLLKRMEHIIEGEVEKGATIKGKVSIGKGTRVLAGSYIEGPVLIGSGCVIGPNCYIRPHTSVGDRCRVGNACEVKNSVVGDGSKIPHLNYVGDSVIGEDVNLAAGTITANLRHDRGMIKSVVKGELAKTGKNKFGTAIGDGAKLGVRTVIYPGRKIWPGMTTLPGQVVDKDITG